MKRIKSTTYLIITLLLIMLVGKNVNAQKQVTFESIYSFEYVSNPSISPDGAHVVFSTRQPIVEENHSVTSLWIMNKEGKEIKKITSHLGYSINLLWVDSENLSYLKKGNIYVYNLESGKEEQLTDFDFGIGSFRWIPNTNSVLITRDVYPENNSIEYFKKKKAEEKNKKHSGLLYDELLFRPYFRYSDGTVTHIFSYDLTTKELNDLTPGEECAPTSHLGGSSDVEVSPDGNLFAYTMNTDEIKALSTNNDIFIGDFKGSEHERISNGKGRDFEPRFSPDGRYLCYMEMAREMYESDQRDIILVDLKTKEKKNLTSELDRTIYGYYWSPDSKNIYINCPDKGMNTLYKINVDTGEIESLLKDVYFGGIAIDEKGGNLFLTTGKVNQPDELYKYDLETKDFEKLTHFSDDFVKNYKMGGSETFWYKGAQDEDVMGFITYPTDYDPNKKYPMIMLFHGGPEGAWTVNFSNYGWNNQLLSANGYFVVKINPHGSNSYGIKFQEDLLGRWGEIDVEDVMKGLDYVLAKYPAIDPERVGAAGRSYGGFLVNMLNGKTDRFKCYVSVDGVFNQVMNFYSTDELWFPYMEFGGTPVTNPEVYKNSSPDTYAANFKTPTLVMHGSKDYRLDDSQGIGMYTALQVNKVPSKLLIFRDEGHYFIQLQSWKYANEVQLEWFKEWLQ